MSRTRGGRVAFGFDVFQLRAARVVVSSSCRNAEASVVRSASTSVGARSRRAKVGFGLLKLCVTGVAVRFDPLEHRGHRLAGGFAVADPRSADSRSASTVPQALLNRVTIGRTSRNAPVSVCASERRFDRLALGPHLVKSAGLRL